MVQRSVTDCVRNYNDNSATSVQDTLIILNSDVYTSYLPLIEKNLTTMVMRSIKDQMVVILCDFHSKAVFVHFFIQILKQLDFLLSLYRKNALDVYNPHWDKFTD